MDFGRLDFNSIIKMYQRTNNLSKVKQIAVMALDNFSQERNQDDYNFLMSLTLPIEIIERYKDNKQVLQILALKGTHPQKTIWNLVAEKCDFETIFNLAKKRAIPSTYLEKVVIKSKDVQYYFKVLEYDYLEINSDALVDAFLKLEPDLNDKTYLNCIKLILFRFPYNEETNLRLVKILCHEDKDCCNTIVSIIEELLRNSNKEFEKIIKQRRDFLTLFKFIRSDKFVQSYYIFSYKQQFNSAIEDIKFGNITDIAWYIFLHDISEEYRIDILNYWASHDNIIAFDTYFKYLTGDNLDYENVGAALDIKYQSKLTKYEEESELTRKRKKTDDKISFPGLKED